MNQIRLNRSRYCRLCDRSRFRVLVPSPTATDPDYTVAVCPRCDMTIGRGNPQLREVRGMRVGAWRRPVGADEIAHKIAKFDARLMDLQEMPGEDDQFQAACGEWFLIQGSRMAAGQDRCQVCKDTPVTS